MKNELKPCPFCGQTDYLTIGEACNPEAFWDSRMRGEHYAYVQCHWCDLIMKKESVDELIRDWNKRGDDTP